MGLTDVLRSLWIPEYDIQTLEVMGGGWPDIIVEKWERNSIGERRFVTSHIYPAPRAQRDRTDRHGDDDGSTVDHFEGD